MPGMRSVLSACLRGLLAWLLAGTGAAWAQGAPGCPPPPPMAADLRPDALAAQGRDRGLLWRLDKDGRSSWLYGTVHLSRPEWALPGPRIRAAMAASDVVALELDPADPQLPRLLLAATDAARNQRVLAGLQPQLRQLAAGACLPAPGLARMPALVQLMTIAVSEARHDGFHPELAVDSVLLGLAGGLGKRFVALETPAQQLAALALPNEDDERELVEQGLADLASGHSRTMLLRLTRAWAAGDEADLASYPQWCRCQQTPAQRRFNRRLNDERNPALADQLAALHGAGQRFFAGVGALHMTGPQALSGLLRARGFEVRRVQFSAQP